MAKTKKKYKLTAEHEAMLVPWRDKWIANAMSTEAMTEADREVVRKAVNGMYKAAGIDKPPIVVFSPSPFVTRFAGGFAAAIWHLRKTSGKTHLMSRTATRVEVETVAMDATRHATWAATNSATRAATEAAAEAATDAATRLATRNETEGATRVATRDAIQKATWNETEVTVGAAEAATGAATWAATWVATRAATEAATEATTRTATRVAVEYATQDATNAATEATTRTVTRFAVEYATQDATNYATQDATNAATEAATRDAMRAATQTATRDGDIDNSWFTGISGQEMHQLSASLGLGSFGLECAKSAWNMYQGGNQWSGWDAFLSFFKDVAKLPLDYSKYEHWLALAEHSGPRIVHKEFCIVTDRPSVLKVDDQNRPHCEDGPFCVWRDGTALYAWHGTYIPARWVTTAKPTATEALTWPNIEQRRAACEIVGWAAILDQLSAKTIDKDGDPEIGELLEVNLPDIGRERFLKVRCGTGRTFALPVPLDMKTAIQANAWTYGLDPKDIFNLEVRT